MHIIDQFKTISILAPQFFILECFRMAEEIAKLKEDAEIQRQEDLRCKMELSSPSATLKSVTIQYSIAIPC